MPELSRFYGIVVFMNYNDHEPPHFHARYQEQEITMEIPTGVVQGKMSKRRLRLVQEWFKEHQAELMENWKRARKRQAFRKIAPLI